MPKGIRKAVIPAFKNTTLDSRDLAPAEKTVEAVASFNNLVTASTLAKLEVEDVVIASPLDKDGDRAYLNELKFQEERVDLYIPSDNSEFPIDPVSISNNGKQVFIKRDTWVPLPRKFVESLCSPLVRISTRQTKNNLGEENTTLQKSSSFQFPFQLRDSNASPRSKAWLEALLARK